MERQKLIKMKKEIAEKLQKMFDDLHNAADGERVAIHMRILSFVEGMVAIALRKKS